MQIFEEKFCVFYEICVYLHRKNNFSMAKRLFYALVALVCMGCSQSGERLLTSATGSIYECLVVSPSSVKEPVCSVLGADMYGLPQMEPYFTVTHVTVGQLDDFLKPTRNILIVDINEQKYTQLKLLKSSLSLVYQL